MQAANGALNLSYVTQGANGKNVGSRTYLMADDDHYQIFKLKNKEFTFDVDVSALPCGLNGALYLVEMDADGGKSKFPTNEAGARLGTGYCDAQVSRAPRAFQALHLNTLMFPALLLQHTGS